MRLRARLVFSRLEELPDLTIGQDTVDWYRQEMERFHALAGAATAEASGEDAQLPAADYVGLLEAFTKPFRNAG